MSTIKLIRKEQETDEQVSWQDQQNINTFSRLNLKLQDLEQIYKDKELEKEYLDDLATELELADEDELVKYKIGDSFVSIPLQDCQSRLEKEQGALNEFLSSTKNKIDSLSGELSGLKTLLYAKFGKSINLEP